MNLRRETKQLTREEMLEKWRLVRHFEPLRSDATVVRSDGIDLDRLLELEIESWYERRLRELAVEDLPQTDVTSSVEMTVESDGSGSVRLPADVVRVAEVMVDGWSREAKVIEDEECAEALDQSNRYTRGGSINPVAVVGRCGVLRLYTPPRGGEGLKRLI